MTHPQLKYNMHHFRKHKRIWTFIVVVSSLAIIATSLAPLLMLR